MCEDTMKSTLMFRDQVSTVTNWFKTWNRCEQTVALYSLVRKLSKTQAKFLLQVLQHSISDCSTDVQVLEDHANDPGYISSLCNESKEHAVAQLLSCLPLLRPGNTQAKNEYLHILPKILAHSMENGCHIEESRQLLSYSLIHPAISGEERSQFTLWLNHLEDRTTHNAAYQQQQQHARLGQSNSVGQDLLSNNTSNGVNNEHNNTVAGFHNYVHNMTSAETQQQQQQQHVVGSRDSGIVMNEPVVMTTTAGLHGFVMTSSCNNKNTSASLTVTRDHCPLQSTLSGPPAFSVPSQVSVNSNTIASQQQPITTPHSQTTNNGHRKLTRSVSITPPIGSTQSSNVSDWLNKHHNEMALLSKESGSGEGREAHPHPPLSPQSSVSSSGSDSQQEESRDTTRNTFLEEHSGMRDVPIWLKSLRLHKYASLFQQLTYSEMMELTEEWLEQKNVTKGARHKIVLSIGKLKERQNKLRTMEKDIMESGNLKQALVEIKNMLNQPIKTFTPKSPHSHDNKSIGSDSSIDSAVETKSNQSGDVTPSHGEDSIPEGDLTGQITRVMGKLCTQLLVSMRAQDENFLLYLQLLDKCMMHEAFTIEHKKKLATWKQQVHKVWHPAALHKLAAERQRKAMNTSYSLNSMLRGQRAVRGQPHILNTDAAKWSFTNRAPGVTMGVQPPNQSATLPLYRNNSLNNSNYVARPQGLYELKQAVTRTHSAPLTKSNQFVIGMPRTVPQDMSVTEPELNARLETLCRSMTEHALGGFDSPDRGSTF